MRTHTQLKKLFPVLISLAGVTVLVQVAGSGQTSGRLPAPSILPNGSPALEALRRPLLPGIGGAERLSAARPQRNKLGAGPTNPGIVVFLAAVAYGSGGIFADSVTVADVNGDGKPDLLVANQAQGTQNHGSVGVLLGNGDGTFQTAVTYDSGDDNAIAVAVADINGDGKPDLLVANLGTVAGGTVGVLLGNGDGSFQAAVIYASGGDDASSVAVADVNGDGKPDLLISNCSPGCQTMGVVGVLLGNGNGTFQPAVNFDSGGAGAVSVAVADVNGDGKADLVVANDCVSSTNCTNGTLGVLLGNGDGTFQPVVTYGSGGAGSIFAGSVAVADVNGDGKPDVLVANPGSSSIGVLLGNGDGTLQAAVTYSAGGTFTTSVAVADVNGDGKPDLLVTNQCVSSSNCTNGTVGVLLGIGDGTFQPVVTYGSGGSLSNSVAVADVNGDGKPDLLVANLCLTYSGGQCFGNGALGVLLNVTGQPASTFLASSLNPSVYGQSVIWTATVTSSGSIIPTGKVTLVWKVFTETFTIGTATLKSNGEATFSRSGLNADTYPLTALYGGDANNPPSMSAVLNQVVLPTTSSATLTSSPNPSTQGQAVTFTAKIKSPTVTPTGPVTFTAGKTVLGTVQLSGGKATITTSSLPAGSTVVTVTYNGDSDIAKSSASVTQTVR